MASTTALSTSPQSTTTTKQQQQLYQQSQNQQQPLQQQTSPQQQQHSPRNLGNISITSLSSSLPQSTNPVKAVQLGTVEVSKALQDGEKFIKWDEVS